MRLTQTAEYALRVLAHMTTLPEGTTSRAQDLSDITDIPLHYLSKIMRRLVNAGLLRSQKGHGGGFKIAKPLTKIRFIDVLQAVDYEVEPTSCVFGWERCNSAQPCPLHPFWSHLKEDFTHWAENYTLADVKTNHS
ncbi:MAG: RrF2 family transcriptional regulator [Rhodothermales bacterium]